MKTTKLRSVMQHALGGLQVAALLLVFSIPNDSAHAQTIWIAGVGNWSTPGNWSLGVPNSASGTTFDAHIKNGGTAQLSAAGASVRRMRVGVNAGGNGNLEVNGGGLTVTENLHLAEGGTSTASVIVQQGGIVTVPTTVVGFTSGTSNFTITGAGSRVNATTSFVVGSEGQGTLILADGGTLAVGNGTLPLQVGTSIFGNGTVSIGNGGAAGVLQASAVQFGFGAGQLAFNHTGSLTFATPITGSGGVSKSGLGTTTLSATNSYSGATSINGGKLAISADRNLGATSGSVVFNGGTLLATQDITLAATRSIGFSANGGTIEVDATKTFTYPNNLLLAIGKMNKTGAGTLSIGDLTVGASPPIGPYQPAELLVTGGGRLSTSLFHLGDDNDTGRATISGPGTTVTNTYARVGFSGFGYLNILDGGSMHTAFDGHVGRQLGTGIATVRGAGSTWTLGNDLHVIFDPDGAVGVLNIEDQALVYVGNTLNNDGAFVNLSGGTLRFNNYSEVNDGEFNFNSGTIQLAGSRSVGTDAAIAKFFDPSPIIPTGKGLTVEGTATLPKTLTINGGTFKANSLIIGAGGALDFDRGVLELTGGTITGLASLVVPPNGEFRANAVQAFRITGAAGSTITATGNLTLGNAAAVNGFGTQGTLQVGANSVTLLDANDVVFDSLALATLGSGASPGTLNAANGLTLDFGGNITGFGTVTTPNNVARPLINNGHITGNSAAQRITLPGYVKGVGTFDNVNFTGTFSPGLSPTILSVGNLALSPTSTLIMEIGGTSPGSGYDQLESSGAITFDGTLQVSLINGFSPGTGQTFNFFDWASVSGAFDALQLPTLAGLVWDTSQLYLTGVLLVAPALAADFDEDGGVDGDDLTRWRDNFGTGATHMQGDADADGDADGADFLIWQRQLGSGMSSTAAASVSASAVPEPSALMLLALAIPAGWRLAKPRVRLAAIAILLLASALAPIEAATITNTQPPAATGTSGANGNPGGAGGVGGTGNNANANATSPDVTNTASATGGAGGKGGTGGDGVPSGANGGIGGEGGAGGNAGAQANTSANVTGTANADVTATGGAGGSGGTGGSKSGTGTPGATGDGSHGGTATASGTSSNSGGAATLTVRATGGAGGAGNALFSDQLSGNGGHGGGVSLGTVFAMSMAPNAPVTVGGFLNGGSGGNASGLGTPQGGNGASVSLIDGIDGASSGGGSVTLTQVITAGSGGSSTFNPGSAGDSTSSLTRSKTGLSGSQGLTLDVSAVAGSGGDHTGPAGTNQNGGAALSFADATNDVGRAWVTTNAMGGTGGSGFFGADGALGGNATGTANATASGATNLSSAAVFATGGNGGAIGNGSVNRQGGAGGNAMANVTVTAAGSGAPTATTLARGGIGGSVVGTGTGSGGNGGNATTAGTAGNAGNGAVGLTLSAVGGTGGTGMGAGNTGGNGGTGQATASGTSSGAGSVSVTANQTGGVGGTASGGATAGAGGSAVMTNRVSGSTAGQLTLTQNATGGTGGQGTGAVGTIAGLGGSAASALTATNPGGGGLSIALDATGGAGGRGISGADGSAGGDATAIFSLTNSTFINSSANATGGAGGQADLAGNGGDGGRANLGSLLATATGGASASATGIVTGGVGGSAVNSGGNAGAGFGPALIDRVDADTTGAITLRQTARGGAGGSATSGSAGAGGAAVSSLSRTKNSSSLIVTAEATGGLSGTKSFATGSAPDGASASATSFATNSGGFAWARTEARGGGGGQGRSGASGGIGGNATGMATARSIGDGHAAQANGDVYGGGSSGVSGGSNSLGGDGGSATGVSSATAEGNSTATSTNTASGGNGGDIIGGTGIGGHGGSANSTASATGAGTASVAATATAAGGTAALSAGGAANGRSGDAFANASATGLGLANATANANGGSGFGGRLAGAGLARATVRGATGLSRAVANSSGGAIITSLSVDARAPAGGTTITEARFSIGGPDPGAAPAAGLQSASYFTALPTAGDAEAALTGHRDVHVNFNVPGGIAGPGPVGDILGLATLGSAYAADDTGATRAFSSSFTLGVDLTQLTSTQHLLVGFLDADATGNGFDTLRLRVTREFVSVFDMTFNSLATAVSFFDGKTLDFGQINTGVSGNLDLAFTFDTTSHAVGDSFRLGLILGNGTLGAGPLITTDPLYWDGSNVSANGVIDGGSGTWTNAAKNWTNSAGTGNEAWGSKGAVFGGAAGTVTIGENVSASGLRFTTSGYVVNAGAGLSLTLAGAATEVRVDAGATATINAPLAGGVLNKDGDGKLIITTANSYSGGTTVTNGQITILNAAGHGLGTGPVSVLATQTSYLSFEGNASAGAVVITNLGGNSNLGDGGVVQFLGTATGGTAHITNLANTANNGFGGLTTFSASSRGGSITIENAGAAFLDPVVPGLDFTGAGAGRIFVRDSADLENATITNFGAAGSGMAGGGTAIFGTASAGSSTIINRGGLAAGNTGGLTEFSGAATAGASVIKNERAAAGGLTEGGNTNFRGASLAGTATFTNEGALSNAGAFGLTSFYDASNAQNGTFLNGASIAAGTLGGRTIFYNASRAASAVFDNEGSTVTAGYGGEVLFFDTASADAATITNRGVTVDSTFRGAMVRFFGDSTGGTATIVNEGSAYVSTSGIGGGSAEFLGGASAEQAVIFNRASTALNGGSGRTTFDSIIVGKIVSADRATITNDGGAFAGRVGGRTNFASTANAGAATLTNRAGQAAGAYGGTLSFDGASSANAATINNGGAELPLTDGGATIFSSGTNAGTASFFNLAGTVADAAGGFTWFFGNSTATQSVIRSRGAAVAGAGSGNVRFFDASTADRATLYAEAGVGAAPGGAIIFDDTSDGGAARAILGSDGAGGGFGLLDISQLTDAGMGIGSIEGSGSVRLGSKNLAIGGNNLSTTFAGVIDGLGGSLTKLGPGKLTLAGANAYTGLTTIQGGTLAVNGSIPGAALVKNGGTLGGSGAIGAMVTVENGGIFAPGNSPGTIAVAGLNLMNGAMLNYEIGVARDHIVLTGNGNVTLGGVLNVSVLAGFNAPLGQTYSLFEGAIGSITGAFSAVNTPYFNGHTFDVLYGANQVTLQVSQADFLAADFDEDLDVDGSDLARWKTGFGNVMATHMQGDSDGDGDADGADFLTWQRQLGSPPVTAASTPVPEPATVVLLVLAATGLIARKNRTAKSQQLINTWHRS